MGGYSLVDGIQGCSKVLGALIFRHFWYIDGWVSLPDPICKIGCILENKAKKAPKLNKLGVFCSNVV